MKRIIGNAFIALLSSLAVTSFADEGPTPFSQCIADSGLKMYSAWWCGYCFKQLHAIDPSFTKKEMKDKSKTEKKFPFIVSCGGEKAGEFLPDCVPIVKNSDGDDTMGTPTWSDGVNDIQGVRSINQLIEATGCNAP